MGIFTDESLSIALGSDPSEARVQPADELVDVASRDAECGGRRHVRRWVIVNMCTKVDQQRTGHRLRNLARARHHTTYPTAVRTKAAS